MRIRSADHISLNTIHPGSWYFARRAYESIMESPCICSAAKTWEQHPDELLNRAASENVVFLCAGDPMVSTTHADLRIRAASRGIMTAIIHCSFHLKCSLWSFPDSRTTGLENPVQYPSRRKTGPRQHPSMSLHRTGRSGCTRWCILISRMKGI